MRDEDRIRLARQGWASFSGLLPAHAAIEELARASQLKRLAPGATLLTEAAEDTKVFLVASGTLRAVRHTDGGHEIWYADVRPGEVIGEIAVLTKGRRTSSVVAKEEAQVFAVEGADFLAAMRHADFATAVACMLADRLQTTSKRMADRVALSVPNRLHRELALLGTQSKTDPEIFHVSPQVVVELAQRIHATREATSRALTELENRNLLKREDDVWTVVVPGGME